MSLFGDSPPTTPSFASAAQSDSLFGQESKKVSSHPGSSLFADDSPGDSPWSLPTPKKSSRESLLKTLLPATQVPEPYVDAFDILHNSGEIQGVGVRQSAVLNIVQNAAISQPDQEAILRLVLPSGRVAPNGLGRGEFNVLLALVGLAQEGEEISLDSVDDRRTRLPALQNRYLEKLQALSSHVPPAPTPAPAPPPPQLHSSSPETPRPARKLRQDSLGGDPASDPWASPANKPAAASTPTRATKPAAALDPFAHTGVNGLARTTSDFSTNVQNTQDTPPHPTDMTSESGAPWGSYNGNTSTDFSEQPTLRGGFGTSPDDSTTNPNHTSQRSVTAPVAIPPGTGELVTIAVLPEKEGMFLFQHNNYEVKTVRRASSVVRRYSDFVWLLDCLQKRYPFRRLPLLPPKRVKVNGNHLAADGPSFIEKRRKGLVRFMNAVVQHPVLSQETLVVMFLTVPTELSVWRKQATISVQEEFVGKALPLDLEDSLPSTLPDLFDQVRAGVKRSAEIYINLCVLLERLAKRNEAMAADNLKFSSALETLIEGSTDTYAIDTNDVPLLNEGINATAKHLSQSHALLNDEAKAWDAGAVEDFKKIRDALVSMKDMFDRRDRYARDNIPQLEKRIQASETKLHALRTKPAGQVKPGEMEKVESSILADKENIVQQHARGVFIKECVRDEIVTFQSTIFAISHLHQDWAQERVKYAELQASNWRTLVEDVESMPVAQS